MDTLKLKRELSSCHFNTPVNQSRWKPYALLGSIHLVARETSFPFKMAGKGLQKNLLLTPFSQARSKSPGSSPSPAASCRTAAWESCRSLTQEWEKGTVPLPWDPEEIGPSLTAGRPCFQFPAHSQASFHGLFPGKNRGSPAWVISSSSAQGCCRCMVWTVPGQAQMCPAVGQGTFTARE